MFKKNKNIIAYGIKWLGFKYGIIIGVLGFKDINEVIR